MVTLHKDQHACLGASRTLNAKYLSAAKRCRTNEGYTKYIFSRRAEIFVIIKQELVP
jgi:hypothetical protein